jgi:predicted ribonuclease YlaK
MQKKLKIDDFCFITNDLALKRIANIFFEDVYSIQEDDEDYYNGFKEIIMTENEMAEFYSLPTDNVLNLLINQYLIIKNEDGEIVDKLVWTGEGYRPLKYEKFKSKWFEVKPMKGDVYQQLVADSFLNNKITLVKGPAGAGKSLLSLGFLLQ